MTKTTVLPSDRHRREQIVVEAKARDLVERRERLVHQQEPRLGHQRTRDRCAHLHAAGELARIARCKARQAYARKRRLDARLRVLRGPCSLSGSRTLAATVAHGIRVGSWKTKPMSVLALPPTGCRHSTRRRCVGSASPAIMRKRRRLAATRRSEQRHEFARPDVEIEIVERHHAARENLADALSVEPALGQVLADAWLASWH